MRRMSSFWFEDVQSRTTNLYTISIMGFIGVLLAFLLSTRNLVSFLNDGFSSLIHTYLCVLNQVRHAETGIQLPTAQYRFPNGQGDAAKFLQGKENSLLWRQQYGSIYRIWSGSTPEIVLTKPEHIKTAFQDSDRHIKAVNNNSGYFLSQLLGECVGLISQDDWKRVKTVTELPFTKKATTGYTNLVSARVRRHFKQLEAYSTLSQGILDPAKDLRMLPFWIVAEIIYGELDPDLEEILAALAPLRENIFRYVISGGLPRFYFSKYLPTRANRELAEFQGRWSDFNDQASDRALRRADKDDGSTSPAPIVHMYNAIEQGQCTKPEILQTLDEMLFANLDVTLGALSWTVVQLAVNIPAQDKLLSEIKKAGPDSNQLFHTYIQSSSTYLQAIISESSRLRPLAAFSVPQSAPTPRIIEGYKISARTNFIVDAHALNQLNGFWGEDTMSFRPERFMKQNSTEARYNFWRFGFGPRQCMGKYVADLLTRRILVELVSGWELGIVEDDNGGDGVEWKRDGEVWIDRADMKLRCVKRSHG